MTGTLRASNVRMSFGGVLALDGATIDVVPGKVVGLIGRNGSGKSTLFNCITGFLKPGSGEIRIGARDIAGQAPEAIVCAGVSRTFQTPRVDFRTTAREAILAGLYPVLRERFVEAIFALPRAGREERELRARANDVIRAFDMEDWADTEIGKLSMGRVRMVEVARAMAANAGFLLLDEPAAGLSRIEQEVLAREIRRLVERGVGVLLVEHNFSLIQRLCDSVTVLDSGRVIFEGTADAVAKDEEVLRVYLGAVEELPAAPFAVPAATVEKEP